MYGYRPQTVKVSAATKVNRFSTAQARLLPREEAAVYLGRRRPTGRRVKFMAWNASERWRAGTRSMS